MKATALLCDENAEFSLQTVQLPELGGDEIRVKTLYSGVSIGTEFALIRKKISWGPFPIVTGYMATGVVDEVGSAVDSLAKGDRVYVRKNADLSLPGKKPVSTVSGTHCSHIISPASGPYGAGLLPEGAPDEAASLFVLPAVGLNGVDMAQPHVGERIVVQGCGLIGLGVVAAATLRGGKVLAIDVEDSRLKIAQSLGADLLVNSSKQNAAEAIEAISPGGADVVFECTGIPGLVDQALGFCRLRGKFVWQGNYGAAPINFSFLIPHGKQLQTFFPCDDGYQPCREAVIKQMTNGVLPWDKTITHRIEADEAPRLFQAISEGDQSVLGATIRWS